MGTVGAAEGVGGLACQFVVDGLQVAGRKDAVRIEDNQVFSPAAFGTVIARLSGTGVGLGVIVQVQKTGIFAGHLLAGNGRTVFHDQYLKVF